MCSLKNEVHLLMKNMSSCCAGGLTFWAVGWGLTMGEGSLSSPYNGWGEFFYEPDWYGLHYCLHGNSFPRIRKYFDFWDEISKTFVMKRSYFFFLFYNYFLFQR